MPTVRRAVAADVPLIAEYNRCLALETEGKTLPADVVAAGVAALLADPGKGIYFVAELDGALVGQLMITTEWSDWRNGWIWWLQSVYVRHEARRQGVFRALFEHVLAAARAEPDVVGMRLLVDHANQTAQQTYHRLGMQRASYLVLERCPL
jgi:GNAT superfamily N-acetyltransferase